MKTVTLALGIAILGIASGQGARADVRFLRADVNVDASVDISDAVSSLLSLFASEGPALACADAADANDDGSVDISDPIYTLSYLFSGGVAPPLPFPEAGCDATVDASSCLSYGTNTPCSAEGALIIDHRYTSLEGIPLDGVEAAKDAFRIYYGHTSHGSQIVSGISEMRDDVYDFNRGAGTLSIVEVGGDLGNPDFVEWASTTRTQLESATNDRNVVLWSWCGQVSSSTEAIIARDYLGQMDDLEREFPLVRFIFMTGHLDGSGPEGNLHARNEQIREFCRAKDKVLFDFADIESYGPDGVAYLALGADDGCYYELGGVTGNWAEEWCSQHPGECSDCSCAHSESLNCDRKARAFWWMMALLAGR